jgi:hypothetical protein
MSAATNTTTPLHANKFGPDLRLGDSAAATVANEVQDTSTSTTEADTRIRKRYRHVLKGLQSKAIRAFGVMLEDSAEKEMREELWNSNPWLRRFRFMVVLCMVMALASQIISLIFFDEYWNGPSEVGDLFLLWSSSNDVLGSVSPFTLHILQL